MFHHGRSEIIESCFECWISARAKSFDCFRYDNVRLHPFTAKLSTVRIKILRRNYARSTAAGQIKEERLAGVAGGCFT